jgi:hypothetical protein
MVFLLPTTTHEYNALVSAAVKFVRSEEEQFKGNLDAPCEDPIVGINYVLDAIGWPVQEQR